MLEETGLFDRNEKRHAALTRPNLISFHFVCYDINFLKFTYADSFGFVT